MSHLRSFGPSGDGWTNCDLGHRHWGRFGAAGLLLMRDLEVLLQLRAQYTHHGGTWSVPGGARNRDETATEAALRETSEEFGLPASSVTVLGQTVDDHGGWSYTTMLARPTTVLDLRLNSESTEAVWVPLPAVDDLDLHPGFRRTWPSVRAEALRLMG